MRWIALAAIGGFLAVGLATRGGGLARYSGTVLYASMIYAGVVFLWPRARAVLVGAAAIGFCWSVELLQLTGVPAGLSARSTLARLALGVQFDAVDLAWYPVGVLPLVALHRWYARRRQRLSSWG